MEKTRTRRRRNKMQIGEALYVFLTGYSTNGKWSLEDWLLAKDIVKNNPEQVSKLMKKGEHKNQNDIITLS